MKEYIYKLVLNEGQIDELDRLLMDTLDEGENDLPVYAELIYQEIRAIIKDVKKYYSGLQTSIPL